jgi:hypothetical protein
VSELVSGEEHKYIRVNSAVDEFRSSEFFRNSAVGRGDVFLALEKREESPTGPDRDWCVPPIPTALDRDSDDFNINIFYSLHHSPAMVSKSTTITVPVKSCGNLRNTSLTSPDGGESEKFHEHLPHCIFC